MEKAPIVRLREVTKRFDDVVAVDALNLDIFQGEFLTLLGPSGCGKTTVLRLIAGFESLDKGEIIMNGVPLNGTPPNKRNVNTVFQSYALFPHMTIYDNIAFGLKMKRSTSPHPRAGGRGPVHRQAPRHGAAQATSSYRAASSSGGHGPRHREQAPGAPARRTLSALDYRLRQEMEIELKRIHRKLGITFVFVTHDQEEAISMSDRIAVMNQGRIEQIGTPTRIYEEPENMFVAKFVGEINIFEGRITEVYNGSATVDIHGQPFKVLNRKNFTTGEHVKVLLRPEDLIVTRDEDSRPVPPSLGGVIDEVIYKGKTVDLIVSLDAGESIFVTQFFNEDQEDVIFQQGQRVHVDWPYGWEVVLQP